MRLTVRRPIRKALGPTVRRPMRRALAPTVTVRATLPFGVNRSADGSAQDSGAGGVVVGAGVVVSAGVEAGDAAGGAGEPPPESQSPNMTADEKRRHWCQLAGRMKGIDGP